MDKKDIIDFEKVPLDDLIALDFFISKEKIFHNVSLYGLLNEQLTSQGSPYVLSNKSVVNYSVSLLKPTQDGLVGSKLQTLHSKPFYEVKFKSEKEHMYPNDFASCLMKYSGKFLDLREMPILILNNRDYSPKGLYILVGHIRARYHFDEGLESIRCFTLDCVSDSIMSQISANVNSMISKYSKESSFNIGDIPLL